MTESGEAKDSSEAVTAHAPIGKKYRSGFVAIIGRPNAGKSTLLNRLVGQKIAIVTSKPQTTRNRIQGIVTRPEGQVVFIDTPGIHAAGSALGRQMMHEVAAALEGVDLLLVIVDATNGDLRLEEAVLEKVRRFEGRTILALNKVDRLPRPKLLPMIATFRKALPSAAMVPISALKGEGCEDLLNTVICELPEGEPYFPEDQVTDQPERFLAGEIVREKAVQNMYHEVPYALAVVVDKYEETPKLLRMEMTLHVERDTQKKILIGHKGEMLKRIGTAARKELETLLGTKVYLGLFVKVVPNWRESPLKVRELDWHFQLENLSRDQGRREGPDLDEGEDPGDE